jgi:hypothetical protein
LGVLDIVYNNGQLTLDTYRFVDIDDTIAGDPKISSDIEEFENQITPTSIYPLKGSDYFLQASGVRFSYNPHRMIFDRITVCTLTKVNTFA